MSVGVLAQSVRVGVLGLFHPDQIILGVPSGSALILRAGQKTLVLEPSAGAGAAHMRLSGDTIVVDAGSGSMRGHDVIVRARQNGAADFTLAIPGKITRHYLGTLQLKPIAGSLVAIVSMDLETAVASVVAAESAPDTPLEALKAQAVATRSYFTASRGRHHDFDFCDTTHCQFLRNPPVLGTPVAQAVAETRGLVLAYRSEPIPVMYTRSCSGRTRTPADVGLAPGGYPYFSVDCRYCREHPTRWLRQLSAQEIEQLHPASETDRLKIGRRLGWNTVPSDTFSVKHAGDAMLLEGTGQGHGIGLCQTGASAMAREGATFLRILAHYYPNTTIVSRDRTAASVR